MQPHRHPSTPSLKCPIRSSEHVLRRPIDLQRQTRQPRRTAIAHPLIGLQNPAQAETSHGPTAAKGRQQHQQHSGLAGIAKQIYSHGPLRGPICKRRDIAPTWHLRSRIRRRNESKVADAEPSFSDMICVEKYLGVSAAERPRLLATARNSSWRITHYFVKKRLVEWYGCGARMQE